MINFLYLIKIILIRIIRKTLKILRFLRSFSSQKNRLLNNPGSSFVYFQNFKKTELVIPSNNEIRGNLIPDELIIKKGIYHFDNQIYTCKKFGIYRFIRPQFNQEQRLILSQKSSLNNALILSLTSLRGNRDDNTDIAELQNLSKERYLSLTCGPLSSYIQTILKSNGFISRKVHSYKINIDNSYNCGHTMLEVWEESKQKFILVDVDKKFTFKRDNDYLSFIELCECIRENIKYKIVKASDLSLIDLVNFKEKITNFNYGFIENYLNNNEQNIIANFKEIMQIPVIEKEKYSIACYTNKKEYEFCKRYLANHKILPKSKFKKYLYTN